MNMHPITELVSMIVEYNRPYIGGAIFLNYVDKESPKVLIGTWFVNSMESSLRLLRPLGVEIVPDYPGNWMRYGAADAMEVWGINVYAFYNGRRV